LIPARNQNDQSGTHRSRFFSLDFGCRFGSRIGAPTSYVAHLARHLDVIPNRSEKTGEEPSFVPASSKKAGSSPGLARFGMTSRTTESSLD
jgi:hypothetical protein